MSKVVVVGSCNCDLTIRLARLPGVGETVSEGEFFQCFGGKGANQALAACRAGATVGFLCKLGQDTVGDNYRKTLIEVGIYPEGLLQDDVFPTGMAFILVDQAGRNQIAVAPGANHHLLVQDVLSLQDLLFRGSQVLLVQLEIPIETVRCALEVAKSLGITTILDPAPSRPLSPEIFSLTDIITPNEVEAEYLTGFSVKDPQEAERACQRLLALGVGGVIITMADNGAFFQQGDQKGYIPAFSVPSVDSTAAGDAFNGALACVLSERKPLSEAIVVANAAGALATTQLGAQPALPTRSEIEALLSRQEMRKQP